MLGDPLEFELDVVRGDRVDTRCLRIRYQPGRVERRQAGNLLGGDMVDGAGLRRTGANAAEPGNRLKDLAGLEIDVGICPRKYV